MLEEKGEIARLFARLRPKGEKAEREMRPVREGVTYHLLAYDEEGAVTHIRVFLSSGSDSGEVYPRPNRPYSYLSDQIRPWLLENFPLQASPASAEPPAEGGSE